MPDHDNDVDPEPGTVRYGPALVHPYDACYGERLLWEPRPLNPPEPQRRGLPASVLKMLDVLEGKGAQP